MRRLIMTALCCAGALLLLQGRAPAEQPDRTRDYDLAVERALLDREVDAYLTATAAAGEPAPNEFEFHWSKGIRFDSHDGNFRFKLGGRIMVDTVFQDGNDPLETIAAATGQTDPQQVDDDRIFFRRVRLYVSGTIHRNVFFKAQFDFAKSSETEFKDLYIGLKDIAVVGHVRFGNQFEPHGLEMNTSSKYITFIERSMPTGAFGRERRVGVLFYDAVMEREGVRRLYWAVGVFRPTETASGDLSSEDGYELTFRITGLPLHRSGSEGVTLLHVGFSFQYRTPEDGTIRFRSRG
ncbi:MAG: porin, partial [Planctomycetota bacterium]